jgi:hypothetical protein
MLSTLITVFLTTTTTIAIEYALRELGFQQRPSYHLSIIANWSIRFWRFLGETFAWLSSYLDWFDMTKLLQTIRDLFLPVWNIMTSPIWFLWGYINTADLYNHPYLVVLGSVILITLISATIYYCVFNK